MNIQETIQRLESKGWTKHADAVRELVRERDDLKRNVMNLSLMDKSTKDGRFLMIEKLRAEKENTALQKRIKELENE
jgi:hypothetical protein